MSVVLPELDAALWVQRNDMVVRGREEEFVFYQDRRGFKSRFVDERRFLLVRTRSIGPGQL
jgi:hypothetical protein